MLNNINLSVKEEIMSSRTSKVLPKYDVYLAAGFFNERQNKAYDMLEDILMNTLHLKVFRPKNDAPQISLNSTEEERQANFSYDVKAIDESYFLIASTEGKDMGTIWECGYAYAKGIPTYGFAPLLPEGAAFNLMLANSMIEVFISKKQAEEYFLNNVKPPRIGAE